MEDSEFLQQLSYGKFIALTSIIINLGIFGVKGWIGLSIASIALISDSLHSFSDSASSLAVYLGFKISEKPADEKHPFGHGRAEHVALLAVGIILGMAAVKFFTDGLMSLMSGPEPIEMSYIFYLVIISTAVAKEIMGEASYIIGKKIDSDPLKADAWHHRSDALTTVLVVGSIYGSQIGYPFLDPLAGILISILLGYIGLSYIKKATDRLLGTSPSDELLTEIKEQSRDIQGVKDIHDIKVHDYGDKKAISLHMTSEAGTLKNSHSTAHTLENSLEENFDAYVEVHVDPWTPPEDKIEQTVKETVEERDGMIQAHQIEISEKEECVYVSFHLVLPGSKNIEDGHETATTIEEELTKKLENITGVETKVQVHLEPESSEL